MENTFWLLTCDSCTCKYCIYINIISSGQFEILNLRLPISHLPIILDQEQSYNSYPKFSSYIMKFCLFCTILYFIFLKSPELSWMILNHSEPLKLSRTITNYPERPWTVWNYLKLSRTLHTHPQLSELSRTILNFPKPPWTLRNYPELSWTIQNYMYIELPCNFPKLSQIILNFPVIIPRIWIFGPVRILTCDFSEFIQDVNLWVVRI